MNPPNPINNTVVVLFDCNGDILEDFNFIPLSELKYKVDYSYGDVLGIAERITTFTTFSHWHYIPGGTSKDRNPVWNQNITYNVLEKYKVGQKGILKPYG